MLLFLALIVPLAARASHEGSTLADPSSDSKSGISLGSGRHVKSQARDFEKRLVQSLASPRVYQVENFLSDEECAFLKQHAEGHLRPSLTVDKQTGEFRPDPVRTNQQMYLSKEDHHDIPMIADVVHRMHLLARVPLGHGEQLQVGRYTVGEKYDVHYDSDLRSNMIRTVTVIVYLSDVEAGGHTVFPMGTFCNPLTLCCNANATSPVRHFHPKKGEALMFYSHDLDGTLNPLAVHGSCAVEKGTKWITQAWFRSHLYPESPHYPGSDDLETGDA
eukprot:CAMPEP_0170570792 /NCGR_PEP_ID=MMETSP0224-20130122/1305_1 /TAXON_ID=285029 /ORGANISM="Togula jolla, Strain CCCM 725" /LENGTH=274 /DNA_ID=CAMNT_0010893105 /DNA_START=51 /DNA_END=871 /DNA_ORIENTATION=+